VPRLKKGAMVCALTVVVALPAAGAISTGGERSIAPSKATVQSFHERMKKKVAARAELRKAVRQVRRCNRKPYPGETWCPVEWNTRPSSHPASRWYIPEAWLRAALDRIGACESHGNPSTNTGNGFYGKYQFMLSTWASVGGIIRPDLTSEGEQDFRAAKLYRLRGGSPWPVCQYR
jgi:hypothetical protein